MAEILFPESFTWGAATASYQVEGGWNAEGKGPSVWDMFTHRPGTVENGDRGDTGCDHYHLWEEDLELMKRIGLEAYRFSVSWPRVIPEGIGKVNDTGLGFYDRLVDGLLEAGVEPWLTLFHWDFPYALYLKGGWLNPDVSRWFGDYTAVLVDALSDRVSNWISLNEPQCFIGLGHLTGEHAPGLRLGFDEALRVAHNALLAHGTAVDAIRSRAKHKPRVGVAPVGVVKMPATATEENIELARQEMFSIKARNFWNHAWFGDPMVLGHYPEDGLRLFGDAVPDFPASDLDRICRPLDFYGINLYFPEYIVEADGTLRHCMGGELDGSKTEFTALGWPVKPEAMYWGLRFLHERYRLPMVVTENGLANPDWPAQDGAVHDPQRIDFIGRYLLQVHRAIAEGVDVRGYFAWTLMDNFEWSLGYRPRFGLIHVDYPSRKRTLKDSAWWYSKVIGSRGACLDTR
jgi:beta-glucosidase